MTEQWREIPDTQGIYWASDLGRIKRVAHVSKRGTALPEKILKLTPNRDGHLQVGVFGKLWTVHKLVYLAWRGSIPKGLVVRHRDDVKDNNVPSNLLLGTQAQNMDDVRLNGGRLGRKVPIEVKNGILADLAKSHRHTSEDFRLLAQKHGVCSATIRRYAQK